MNGEENSIDVMRKEEKMEREIYAVKRADLSINPLTY
jgi:hypothetical protein